MTIIRQALLGAKMLMNERFCATCGASPAPKRCSVCKTVFLSSTSAKRFPFLSLHFVNWDLECDDRSFVRSSRVSCRERQVAWRKLLDTVVIAGALLLAGMPEAGVVCPQEAVQGCGGLLTSIGGTFPTFSLHLSAHPSPN